MAHAVDRDGRDRYAELLRHFAAGILTNDEYETAFFALDERRGVRDRAIDAVFGAMWLTYDDFRTHRLRGKWALDRPARRNVARAVAFLYSDEPYRWPRPSVAGCLLNLLTLGAYGRWRTPPAYCPSAFGPVPLGGDARHWPFWSRADLRRAAGRPHLLAGGRGA